MRRSSHRFCWSRCFASVLLLAGFVSGCAWRNPPKSPETAARSPEPAGTASPSANIQISYAHPNDYLQSLTVTKFSGARVILTKSGGDKTFSIVRFEGGRPVWEITNQTGLGLSVFEHLPGVGAERPDALKSVSYGRVPPNFVQTAPDYGSPEPLETDKYYVFSVVRSSGAMSFQAIRLQADGSVDSYDADPRAGTSYELCCDLPADFASTHAAAPSDSPP